MKIEWRDPDSLVPYEGNPRRIPAAAVEKLAASIREFGWKQPIVADAKGVVIVGHVRLAASKRLGLKEVPVLVADDLTEDQARAFRIADNRLSEESVWDVRGLTREIRELGAAAEKLMLTAFSSEELEVLRFDAEMQEVAHVQAKAGGEVTGLPDAGQAGDDAPLVPGLADDTLMVDLVFPVPAGRAKEIRASLQELLDTLLGGANDA